MVPHYSESTAAVKRRRLLSEVKDPCLALEKSFASRGMKARCACRVASVQVILPASTLAPLILRPDSYGQ
jgi:hypothetical protein